MIKTSSRRFLSAIEYLPYHIGNKNLFEYWLVSIEVFTPHTDRIFKIMSDELETKFSRNRLNI